MNKAESQAWAAGLFLADGSVGIYKNNTQGGVFHRISFAVRMQEREVVEMFNLIIENPRQVREYQPKQKDKKGRIRPLMFSSENASAEFVLGVGTWMIPLMVGKKRDQFRTVMLLCEDIRRWCEWRMRNSNGPKGTPLPDKVHQYRNQLYETYLRAGAETE